jgi:cold shock CspA family protein
MIGSVKMWKESNGYGFITAGDRDFFVHRSHLVDMTALSRGERVSFDVTINGRDGREMATAVRALGAPR